MNYDTHITLKRLPAKPINTSMFLADFYSADSGAHSTYHKVRLICAPRHRSKTMLRSERHENNVIEPRVKSVRTLQLPLVFPNPVQLKFRFVNYQMMINKNERRKEL